MNVKWLQRLKVTPTPSEVESQSLTNDEVYAVTAYLLHLNGIIGAQGVLKAQTLPQVQMPNREHFILAYSTTVGR